MIRRHLSGTRVLLLDIIDAQPGLDRNQLVLQWSKRRTSVSERVAARVPRMIDQLLWELENLDWVTRRDGRFAATELGQRARSFAHADR
ncbi:hypothetical protein [Microbacterium yannicii]|uniref:hypothetical protein n=1 Tax=Microbacterium yannicii TaxID=671622 RepID=UPI0003098EF8|nr:hypothetical protein [Microbacterium yannicii]